MIDPAPSGLTRVLASADQLVLVAPASPDAVTSLANTQQRLGAHGYGELASRAVTVVNGPGASPTLQPQTRLAYTALAGVLLVSTQTGGLRGPGGVPGWPSGTSTTGSCSPTPTPGRTTGFPRCRTSSPPPRSGKRWRPISPSGWLRSGWPMPGFTCASRTGPTRRTPGRPGWMRPRTGDRAGGVLGADVPARLGEGLLGEGLLGQGDLPRSPARPARRPRAAVLAVLAGRFRERTAGLVAALTNSGIIYTTGSKLSRFAGNSARWCRRCASSSYVRHHA